MTFHSPIMECIKFKCMCDAFEHPFAGSCMIEMRYKWLQLHDFSVGRVKPNALTNAQILHTIKIGYQMCGTERKLLCKSIWSIFHGEPFHMIEK